MLDDFITVIGWAWLVVGGLAAILLALWGSLRLIEEILKKAQIHAEVCHFVRRRALERRRKADRKTTGNAPRRHAT